METELEQDEVRETLQNFDYFILLTSCICLCFKLILINLLKLVLIFQIDTIILSLF